MKKKKNEEFASLNMNMFFVGVVFIILLCVVGLLIGVLYVFRGLGWLQFEAVEFPDWLLVLTLAVASVTLGTLLSYFMSKFVLKASNKIVEGLEKLSLGDFNVRLELGESRAHVQLSEAFNKLAKELEDTKMLRADFINEFAHEFKTPIVSIRGFAQLLTEEETTNEQREEYLDIIIEESERLSGLAHNYLELTKVEKQNILTDLTRFNLSEQIRYSLLLMENKWTKKEIQLDFDGQEVEIIANEDMIKQVWINLIDNAIKFSNQKGQIKVCINIENEQAIVAISNYGQTISEQDQNRIFEKFYRASSSNGVEGSGVGLAIVKKIIDLHKGIVTINSVNGYTTFTVSLPKAVQI